MKCDCRSRIEEKLLERFKEQAPLAREHRAELDGYCLGVVDNEWVSMPSMPIKLTAEHPLKSGLFKRKTTTSNMIFNYCPFCGVKIGKDATNAVGEKAEVAE